MRINSIILLFLFFCSSSSFSQRSEDSPKAVVSCEEQAKALRSGAYVYEAMNHIWPPNTPTSGGISLAVQFGSGTKVVLHTDGEKYQLWLSTLGIPGQNVWDFLEDVAASCRLPLDPADAVKLMNIQWKAENLTRQQFDHLNGDFLASFTKYASTVRERSAYSLATKLFVVSLDASGHKIVYDNTWEHFEILESQVSINGRKTPLNTWIQEFQGFAERSFHRALGVEQNPPAK